MPTAITIVIVCPGLQLIEQFGMAYNHSLFLISPHSLAAIPNSLEDGIKVVIIHIFPKTSFRLALA